MKKYLLLTLSLGVFFLHAYPQYKYDNKLYQTVYMDDLCRQLEANPGYLLLDVRSEGEFRDTSQYKSLNIGHFAHAEHIDIREMDKRWRELLPWKDKPVFVYCSHSQRSRRVSKMLADSGFTQIMNINAGMSGVNGLWNAKGGCADSLYQNSLGYRLLYPAAISNLVNRHAAFIIDLRSDSVFRGISGNEKLNAFGRLKHAVNIPMAELHNALPRIPRNQPLLLVDDAGNDSPDAAEWLLQQGYQHVSIAFDGMDRWVATDANDVPGKAAAWLRDSSYEILSPEAFDRFMKAHPASLLVDLRSQQEFQNQHKDAWRNKGHLRQAVNIPYEQLTARLAELDNYKKKPIVLYCYSGQPEAYLAARFLSNQGFSQVKLISGGLWEIRWRAANLKGRSQLFGRVVDIPPDNE